MLGLYTWLLVAFLVYAAVEFNMSENHVSLNQCMDQNAYYSSGTACSSYGRRVQESLGHYWVTPGDTHRPVFSLNTTAAP